MVSTNGFSLAVAPVNLAWEGCDMDTWCEKGGEVLPCGVNFSLLLVIFASHIGTTAHGALTIFEHFSGRGMFSGTNTKS